LHSKPGSSALIYSAIVIKRGFRLFPYHLTISDKLTLVRRLAAVRRSNRYGAVSIQLQRNTAPSAPNTNQTPSAFWCIL